MAGHAVRDFHQLFDPASSTRNCVLVYTATGDIAVAANRRLGLYVPDVPHG